MWLVGATPEKGCTCWFLGRVSLCPAPTPIRYAEPFESPGDESHCFSSGHFTDGDGERSDIIWGQILEMLALDFGVAIIMNVL